MKAEQIRQQYNIKGVCIRYLEEKEEGFAALTVRMPTDTPAGRTLIKTEEDVISVSNPTSWLHEQPK